MGKIREINPKTCRKKERKKPLSAMLRNGFDLVGSFVFLVICNHKRVEDRCRKVSWGEGKKRV